MDVVVAVPDGDPAGGLVFLPVGRQAGAVHHLVRYGRPLIVGQHAVFGGGAHRAVPHGPGIPVPAHGCLRLQQQPGQLGEVAFAVGPQRGLQRGRMTPARDDMGVGMFLMAARAEQIVKQRFDVLAARDTDLPDHAAVLGMLANVTAGPCAPHRLPGRCGRRGGCCRRRSRAGLLWAARWRSVSRPPG